MQDDLIAETRRGLLDYLEENLTDGQIKDIFWSFIEVATAHAEKDSM